MRRIDFDTALGSPGLSPRSGSAIAAPPQGASTEVELTWIEGRHEQWIRFGRVATERILSRRTRVAAFRPGAVFAFVRWTSSPAETLEPERR